MLTTSSLALGDGELPAGDDASKCRSREIGGSSHKGGAIVFSGSTGNLCKAVLGSLSNQRVLYASISNIFEKG